MTRRPRLYRPCNRTASRIAPAAAALAIAVVHAAGCHGPDGPLEPALFAQPVPAANADLVMVLVPGGEIDGHRIAPFWISRTEVTWDAFDVFVYGFDEPAAAADAVARPSKPYISMDRGFGHSGYPAISMSYKGAAAFCDWLSRRSGRHYRLPTEIEWRFACARGAIDPARLGDHAWFAGNSAGTTHPIGSKAPDAAGLHDMYGNASEWCTAGDGTPVTMGGSYGDGPGSVGCAARVAPSPAWNTSDPQLPKSAWWLADGGFVGFRVVCEADRATNGGDR